MTQDKMRRIVTACVSACTVLLILLFAYLAYQWIYQNQLDRKIKKLQQEIAYYEVLLEDKSDMLKYYESEYFLDKAYRELAALQGDK